METAEEEGISKHGWMKKKSGFFKMWKKCFCELHQTEFYIRKSDKTQNLEKRILITTTTRVSLDMSKKGEATNIVVSNIDDNGFNMILDSNSNNNNNKSSPRKNDVTNNNNNNNSKPENKNNGKKTKKSEIILKVDDPQEMQRWFIALRSATFHNSIISINSFDILSVIGRGFFGKVILVSHKETKEIFAIKTVHKMRLLNLEKVNTILAERNIMRQCKHPFIVNLLFAFQSATKFYLGLEYVPGGELFALMKNHFRFTISMVKLYVAEIALALDHLHSIGVVYRDIKPENILIDKDGHLKLTDFGLSKNIGKERITYSFCGTPDFMAPEVVEKRGHGYAVDWWGLGVLMFELLWDKSPFFDKNRSKMFSNIILKDPTFPENADTDAVDFVKRLLDKNPKNRGTFKTLKNHPFWKGLDFQDVLMKKIKPEYLPIITDMKKPDNFDAEFTNEEAVDSIATPTVGDRSIFRNFSFMGPLDDFIEDDEEENTFPTEKSDFPMAQRVIQT